MSDNVLARDMSEAIVGFTDRATSRLEGLSDAEYLWEPAPGCWSVRPDEGGWRVDLSDQGTQWTDDPPLTTIAWRLWHLGACPEPGWPPTPPTPREFADTWFSSRPASPNAFGEADKALVAFDEHWRRFAAVVAGWHDAALLEAIGPIGGQYGDANIYGLVFHVVDEFIHHSAEVALLRDLYRATAQ
jgi:hypothetical protein